MSIATFTTWHIARGSRWWAFRQMATAGRLLRGVPGLRFARLLGTGQRFGGLWPNWWRYSVMAAWEDEAAARDFLQGSAFAQRYRPHTRRRVTRFLSTLRCSGSWDGEAPFEIGGNAAGTGELAVLTRATLDWRRQLVFWRQARKVEPEIAGADGLLEAVAIGELPVLRSGTFSVWRSADAIARFVQQGAAHRRAMGRKSRESWYREELFARFAVLRIEEEA